MQGLRIARLAQEEISLRRLNLALQAPGYGVAVQAIERVLRIIKPIELGIAARHPQASFVGHDGFGGV